MNTELAENEIHLWYVFTEEAIQAGWLDRFPALMSGQERERYDRFINERARDQHLIARALVRNVLSMYGDLPPREWEFEFAAHGKPSIRPDQNSSQLSFNLAHCPGLVICAVTRGREIGVDCEDSRRKIGHRQFSTRFFAPQEVRQIDRASDAELPSLFFDLWTLKEAYIKAVGAGLSLPLDQFGFEWTEERQPIISFGEKIDDRPEEWRFHQIDLRSPFKTAIAIQSNSDQIDRIALHPGLIDRFSHFGHPFLD